MFKKRKAQGLSIQVVILAVVGLIILVVIIAIIINVSNRASNTFSDSEESCKVRGGDCKLPGRCENAAQIPYVCPDEDDICCVPIET